MKHVMSYKLKWLATPIPIGNVSAELWCRIITFLLFKHTGSLTDLAYG